MRESDEALPQEALDRIKRDRRKATAGLVIAAAGLAAVFVLGEVYVGFSVALVGAGIVPFDKVAGAFKR